MMRINGSAHSSLNGKLSDYPETSLAISHDPTIVCPRYEVIFEYLRITERPLTGLERRAFLYLLDLDADERFVHSEIPGECMCMEILPTIVQALDPDPVQAVVSERTLEGATYAARRYHTERVGKFQGIVLGLKTRREHTSDLRKLARQQVRDLDVVIHELLSRPRPEYATDRAMLECEVPQLVDLVRTVQRKRSAPSLTWQALRDRLEQDYRRLGELLVQLERMMRAWGVGAG